MTRRTIGWSVTGAAAFLVVAGGAWLLLLPAGSAGSLAPEITPAETAALVTALQPPKRERPLIAIVGLNEATEMTDYLVPAGILRRADVADMVLLAARSGPVDLYPAALRLEPEATTAEFDARHPDGADYVIVPAMGRDDDPAILQWLSSQASKHATIIGVCAGAKVVAAAGLLDGRRATTHWYYLKGLRRSHPAIHYVADRRFVVDGGVATTTGFTASMPFCLTLIEAIVGRSKAQAVARDLGMPRWDARHVSAAFQFTRPFAVTALRNRLTFWRHEQLGLELTPGIDEVAAAFVADAWSRTFRSRAVTFTRAPGATRTRNGLRLLAGRVAAGFPAARQIPVIAEQKPAEALDDALREIATRYGADTGDLVAMQLEYPGRDAGDPTHFFQPLSDATASP